MQVSRNTKLGVRLAGAGILAAGGLITYLLSGKEKNELEVVGSVDLSRYAGDWYEIARFPAFFEKNCYNSQAHYELNSDGTLNITNTCNKNGAKGRLKKSYAKAYVTDSETNARLKLKFFGGLVTGDYEIIALDADYRFAMVGTANRKYLWIISRMPFLDKIYIDQLLEKARSLGYNTDLLRFTPQEGELAW
jgi:apolipoprotein D and lipocalin family protein